MRSIKNVSRAKYAGWKKSPKKRTGGIFVPVQPNLFQ
jgi:hypothetical protein